MNAFTKFLNSSNKRLNRFLIIFLALAIFLATLFFPPLAPLVSLGIGAATAKLAVGIVGVASGLLAFGLAVNEFFFASRRRNRMFSDAIFKLDQAAKKVSDAEEAVRAARAARAADPAAAERVYAAENAAADRAAADRVYAADPAAATDINVLESRVEALKLSVEALESRERGAIRVYGRQAAAAAEAASAKAELEKEKAALALAAAVAAAVAAAAAAKAEFTEAKAEFKEVKALFSEKEVLQRVAGRMVLFSDLNFKDGSFLAFVQKKYRLYGLRYPRGQKEVLGMILSKLSEDVNDPEGFLGLCNDLYSDESGLSADTADEREKEVLGYLNMEIRRAPKKSLLTDAAAFGYNNVVKVLVKAQNEKEVAAAAAAEPESESSAAAVAEPAAAEDILTTEEVEKKPPEGQVRFKLEWHNALLLAAMNNDHAVVNTLLAYKNIDATMLDDALSSIKGASAAVRHPRSVLAQGIDRKLSSQASLSEELQVVLGHARSVAQAQTTQSGGAELASGHPSGAREDQSSLLREGAETTPPDGVAEEGDPDKSKGSSKPSPKGTADFPAGSVVASGQVNPRDSKGSEKQPQSSTRSGGARGRPSSM